MGYNDDDKMRYNFSIVAADYRHKKKQNIAAISKFY